MKMPVALSLINMKGGVGKTTIASQLARAAAADGLRVLAVDLDPQSNLSHAIMGPEDYRNHIENNTDVAYFASRYVIVPVKPEYMATIGLPLLARSVERFCGQNADHRLDIAGLVLNDQSEYIDNREKKTALLEVREVAEKYGWHMFGYRIPYSRSYPQAARTATRLARTPYAHGNRVVGFDGLKNEILRAVGIREDGK